MELIRGFGQIGKDDAAIAGGKGASLGEMTGAGIPVPPGFVILSSAFERFLQEADLNQEIDTIILHGVNREEMHTVEHASEKIQQLILGAKIPEDIRASILQNYKTLGASYVAVRSSATAEDSQSAAWAGQLDTFLNTTEDDLLQNVQKCWASLFTPRAIFYRFEKNMHDQKISVAVVVQKMVQSEVSGIAFSVHPVTEDYNQMIIEGGFGLGEAIVSGQITPDSFVIEKTPRRIIDKNIAYQSKALWRAKDGGNEWRQLSEEEGTKPALTDEQALELAELILKIEQHYGFPCDIEWAYMAGTFYITQSRPITTLSNSSSPHTDTSLRPNEYEYLWSNHDINYIFNSCYLSPIFRNADIVLAYEHQQKELKYFLNICDRERIEDWTLDIYQNHFDEWRKTIKQHIIDGNVLIAETYSHKASIPAHSNDQLRSAISERKRVFQTLVDDYFCTEFFAVSKAEALAKDSHDTVLATVLEEMSHIKFEAREVLTQFYNYRIVFKPYLDVIAERFNRDDIEWLDIDEVLALLQGKVISVSTRDQTNWVRAHAFGWELQIGPAAEHIIKDFNKHFFDVSGDSLKGVTANKGSHTGSARILKTVFGDEVLAEIAKVQDGDVLIAATTGPELMVACKRAGAIVTDEGGLTSHAAIVSRELGIPCVVGTRVATKMFKDGDMIEVDADIGVVRILQKA